MNIKILIPGKSIHLSPSKHTTSYLSTVALCPTMNPFPTLLPESLSSSPIREGKLHLAKSISRVSRAAKILKRILSLLVFGVCMFVFYAGLLSLTLTLIHWGNTYSIYNDLGLEKWNTSLFLFLRFACCIVLHYLHFSFHCGQGIEMAMSCTVVCLAVHDGCDAWKQHNC